MVFEVLGTGIENSQSARQICDTLNISGRELRKQIEHERRQGHAICAQVSKEGSGYFLAANKDEMRNFCRRIWKIVNSLAKTCRACQQIIDELPPGSEEETEPLNLSIFDFMED